MESQQELQSEPWTDGPPIRVRIGVHTGEVEERDGNYFGPALNCAARLMGAAHGGQLVVSEVTARLLPRRDEEDNSELPVAPIAWVGASSCFELPSVLWAGGPTVLWDGGPTWRALNSSVVLGALDANHQADQQGVVEQGPMPGVSGQRDGSFQIDQGGLQVVMSPPLDDAGSGGGGIGHRVSELASDIGE